ncbi:MAG TPA: hypothetical protein VJ732_12775 [Bryobacteraceae bacterium]|nr:hypothetical protein [Bryobacteraceae bacterium]
MFYLVCFLYCFFAIVLGGYLGLELLNVRRAERVARTILKATGGSAQAAVAAEAPAAGGEANYFAAN